MFHPSFPHHRPPPPHQPDLRLSPPNTPPHGRGHHGQPKRHQRHPQPEPDHLDAERRHRLLGLPGRGPDTRVKVAGLPRDPDRRAHGADVRLAARRQAVSVSIWRQPKAQSQGWVHYCVDSWFDGCWWDCKGAGVGLWVVAGDGYEGGPHCVLPFLEGEKAVC